MTAIRRMMPLDLLNFNTCNLDHLTETYNIGFYLDYLTRWPDLCLVVESVPLASASSKPRIEGYILGKIESSPYPAPIAPYNPANSFYRSTRSQGQNYLPSHVHITCLTVAPEARRQGHASTLSKALEDFGDKEKAWFVDLFVRKSNEAAVKLYRGMGYSVWRCIKGYYGDGEDAWDMRKPLQRDKERMTIREDGENTAIDPGEVW